MSEAGRRAWLSAQRKVAALQPQVQSDLLRAFRLLSAGYSDEQLARLIVIGGPDALVDALFSIAAMDRAFAPSQAAIRAAVESSFRKFAKDLPDEGKVNGTLAVRFDVLDPHVIDGIRALETKTLFALQQDIRETVRAYVEQGLRDGVGPRAIGRQLRTVIGLSPTQARNAEKYAAKLLEEGRDADQVARMTETYRRRAIALNAETNARTATLDAMKLGQRLAWQDALDNGIVDQGTLFRRWKGVMDTRERDSHVAMEDDVAAFDQPHSNGQMVPGDTEYNCRCIDIYFVA